MSNPFSLWVRLFWGIAASTHEWVPVERRPTLDAQAEAARFEVELLSRVTLEDLVFVDLARGVCA